MSTSSTDKNIQSMLDTAERCWLACKTTVEQLKDGDRIQIKELAQAVGLAVSMDPKDVLGFVNHFAHFTDVGHITRGKFGGIKKGPKPVKVVKVKRAKKVADPVVDATTDTSDTAIAA